MSIKHLSLRIDSEMLDKLHVVADYEGRSANSQILILIRECIEKYEKEQSEKTTQMAVDEKAAAAMESGAEDDAEAK